MCNQKMLVRPKVNHDTKMADEILRMDEKIGTALEMTKDTAQKSVPMPIQSIHVKVLCTLTCSGFAMRIMVIYCVRISFVIQSGQGGSIVPCT